MKHAISLACTVLLVTSAASAAILPGVIGQWKQVSATPLEVEVKENRALWEEYGLQEAETGTYQKGASKLSATAWRLVDSTAAMAAFELVRPADAAAGSKYENLTPIAAITSTGALVAAGNYLVRFEGAAPEVEEVANMLRSMPRYERSGLPTFISYLPSNSIPNSERYVGGPVALQTFLPGISPAAAGFHLSAEAAVAEYAGGLKLALFAYPTPAIARDRESALQKIPGALLKRSGPLVAIVLQPGNANEAELLLAKIRYQAAVTSGGKPSSKKDNPANLLLNIFYLILILSAFCLVSGVMFGFMRMIFHRAGASGDGEEILALHLERR